ncbi:acyl-CoA thioesterase [Mucilaginibacter sp. E4BP6]|uniref:acyl-CoA thioesterase n=1 Tax=Mucilaginibacter sp. E4BP6 TaxID=2723089 RepID=UPI0015CBEDDE|nr:thioesterase family protein [Mucilaginibacter sp. E4BP6]NYE66608.1 acyl-CoA thioester hydrolase [Mucilaginibacter sp. E4BP6]
MFEFTTKIRVRYGETDQMGYVYYGNYAEFYEVARVEMMRSLGMTYKSMEDQGVMMPVIELLCKYLKPALYDQEISIRVFITEMPRARMHFKYELTNEAGELINTGETLLVFVNMKTNRICFIPAELANKLKPYFK